MQADPRSQPQLDSGIHSGDGNSVRGGAELKQRLSRLTADQRKLLSKRLGERSVAGPLSLRPATLTKARPLRIEAAPTESDAGRTIAVYPVGPGQLQMWYNHQLAPATPVYNSPFAFHLLGPLNVTSLEAAFRAVIQRHDTLRTAFTMDEDGLVQCVASSSAFHLEYIDLNTTPAEERILAAERCLEEWACRPFDLAAAPHIRAVLARLEPEEHVLLVVLHHINSDGWSRSILSRDVAAFYRASVTKNMMELPVLPVQFRDYAAYKNLLREEGGLAEATAYWKKKLAGDLQLLDLAVDRTRPALSTFRGDRCLLPLSPDLWTSLVARAQEEGVTLFMVLLAAFKILLHRRTGQSDIRVGVPVANRHQAETEGLIALMINTLVMRNGVSGDLTFRELLQRVKATAVEAYANSELPFERLVEVLSKPALTQRTPVIQTLFALQDFPEPDLDLPGVQVTPWPVDTHTAKVDLTLVVERARDGWVSKLEYSTELIDAPGAEKLLADWRTILETSVAHPERRISDLPLTQKTANKRLIQPSTEASRGLRCHLIGKGSLLRECGEILLQRGFTVLGIVAAEEPVRQWAREKGIRVASLDCNLDEWLRAEPFDYLFSIVNPRILPEPLLKLPARGAINYHNALLPRYAGLYATSWAILNREQRHGITWHRMVPTVDGGDILKQRSLELAPDETPLTLIRRCGELAAKAFAELVEELRSGTVMPVPQDAAKRTYFSRFERPPAAGVISWRRSADEIGALARALDFGPFHNPLGLLKIAVGRDFLLASRTKRVEATVAAPPATIIAMAADSLTVTTASQALEFSGLMTLEGEPLSSADCERRFSLHPGQQLPELEPQQIDAINRTNAIACRHEVFWVKRLESLRTVSLPASSPPSPHSGPGRQKRVEWTIPAEVNAWLARHDQSWSQEEFILAAFGAYLARVTGVESFDMGWTIHPESAQSIELAKLFASKVPFRFTIDIEHTMESLLPLVRAEIAEMRRRRTFGRDIVPRHPQLRRIAELSRGFNPRVNVQLVECLSEAGECQDGEFRLIIPEKGFKAGAVFSEGAFDGIDVEEVIGRFSFFLKSLAVQDDKILAHATLISDSERQTLLKQGNGTEAHYDFNRCIHQLFEEQAASRPDAVAVVLNERSLTYGQLNQRANQLAQLLRQRQVGPDTLVGLFVERSLEMVIGVLGILKAGGAYVPLEPRYPKERLEFILEDSQPKVLLSTTRLAPTLPDHAIPTLCLDELPEPGALEFLDNVASEVTPENLAYAIYTSGSTGRPNGVLIGHRSLVNYILAGTRQFNIQPDDRFLQFAPLSFDVSAEEIYLSLGTGATLMLRTDEMISQAAAFLDRAEAWKLTVIDLPTAYWSHLTAEMAKEGLQLPPSIRLLIIGGERASPETLAAWQQKAGRGVTLWNTYGPTETTIATTWCELTSEPAISGQELPIGRPVPNTAAYVLDRYLQPVPAGVAGELFIGGIALSRGYLNRPELTAKRFVSNPFTSTPGDRLYRTGDKVRYRRDGLLEFHGRIDQQVKIRGHRIEVGEVELALGAHPEIRGTAVIARKNERGETDLVAFAVAQYPDKLSLTALREWLAARLPEYMVPARFAVLPSLPLTTNGKVDRKALETVEAVELSPGSDYVPPRDLLERQLVEIWKSTLRHERIGIHDNFFDLGGHSLLAVAINSRITRLLGVELPLRWVFEHPTIERLARRVEALAGTSEKARPMERADRQQPLPMSFAQQQMWLLHQILPNPAAYNVPFACRLSGGVDRGRLRRALQVVFERHEVLRTALVHEKGDLIQRIVDPGQIVLPWEEVDLSTLSQTERPKVLAQRLTEEAHRSFDLARAPLWRVTWVKLDSEEHVLAFTFHHSIMDEWSLRLFFNEWTKVYQLDGRLESAGLPELSVQYADFAVWQREKIDGDLLARQRRYWMTQLKDLPPALELPGDRTRPTEWTGSGAVHHFEIQGPIVTSFRDLARKEETTLFSVLLAAFQVWLHRYTGQSDLVVGTPVARRDRPEVQALLGYFLNTVPILARLDRNSSFSDALRQLRELLLGAFGHADLPFEQMAEMALKERQAGQNVIYQVMFVLLDEPWPAWRLDDVKIERLPLETCTSKNHLTLSVRAGSDGCDCRFEYSTELFSADAAARMAGHFTQLLHSIASDPNKPIGQLNLLPEDERQRMLVDWNQTHQPYPEEKCIQQLFEEQVERTPDAVAVVDGKHSLSYRELNTRSNRLAHHLRGLSVGPDVTVGLCLDRSIETVVALLAILKAGGAYVPLDPALPHKRLAFLIRDASCPVGITHKSLLPIVPEEGPAAKSPVWVALDTMPSAVSAEEQRNPAPINAPDDLAYVLYTSGSTGQPKGVEMPHRALVNLVQWQCATSGMGAGHRTLQFASLGFDVSFQEIFSTWCSGGILMLIPDETRRDPAALLDVIDRAQIHRLFLPFVMLERVAEIAEKQKARTHLKEVIVAGEQLRIGPAMRRFFERLPGCRFWNHYGPTESHVVTAYQMTGPPSSWPDRPPIGRPVANCQVYLLDSEQNPVPSGVFGELCIGGVCLSRGYRQRPDLTQERYFTSPFSHDPNARLYRTGDLCRWQTDGQLDYCGRLDHQVKIRGYRVELGEIESLLCQIKGVRETVVLARDNASGEKQLVAYVVTNGNGTDKESELQDFLKARLPEYMLPTHVEFLSALPLTANGKIDRRALPEPSRRRPANGMGTVPPRNLLELQLIRLWQELFQRQDIGAQENFFALGGHSLLAARLAARIENLIGCKLPIAALFQSPTIESLGRRLCENNWAPQWSSLVPLQPMGSKPPLFFVHGWGGDVYGFLALAQRLAPSQPAYGLQAVGLDGKAERHTTVEEMAAHYVREIRSFQREGPYYLTGFSMGGLIAFEMAQQLYQLGQRVAFLGLLDTSPRSVPWTVYGRTLAPHLWRRGRFHLRRWWQMPIRDRFSYLRRCWGILRYRIVRNRPAPAVVMAPPEKAGQPPQIPGFEDYYWAVASAYRLRRYPGQIDVFLSDSADPALMNVWRHLARGGALQHRVPGRHIEIIGPKHLTALTDAVRIALERAQRDAGTPGSSDLCR